MKLFGETVQVAAEICKMPGISGHADVNGLIEWAKAFETRPKHVFVTHGDDTVTEILPRGLKKSLGMMQQHPLVELNMIFWRTGVSMRLLVFGS